AQCRAPARPGAPSACARPAGRRTITVPASPALAAQPRLGLMPAACTAAGAASANCMLLRDNAVLPGTRAGHPWGSPIATAGAPGAQIRGMLLARVLPGGNNN